MTKRKRPVSRHAGAGAAMAWTVLIASGFALAAVLGVVLPMDARSQEHNFAGSLQSNYTWVPTDKEARKEHAGGEVLFKIW